MLFVGSKVYFNLAPFHAQKLNKKVNYAYQYLSRTETFDFAGRADAYGGKSSLILFLVMGWFLYAVMIAVSLFPETWNTGVAVTEANRERVYSVIRTMLSVLTFAIALFFSCTVFCSAQGKPLPVFALPVFLLLIFGSLIVSLVRLVISR